MSFDLPASDRPVLFCLHALGASRAEFSTLDARLGDMFETIAIDLPGFGDAPASLGTSVEEMVRHVAGIVAGRAAPRWMLLGHSMGGKIATILAARALAGEPGLFGLAGVVLLAGSPPSPEPMDEERREDMLSWVQGGQHLDEAAARRFIDANVGSPLSERDDALMRADLRRADPRAWAAWLERGSREDWSATVGTLPLPALILAGGADGDLGPDGQRRTNGTVYPGAELEVLDGAGHLLPLERPDEVADAIRRFWNERAGVGPAVPADFAAVIASERVSARTRSILAYRYLACPSGEGASVLSGAQMKTLRALAARVVPQDEPQIDLAERVAAQLAKGAGDGWRLATLPPDLEAYRAGLDALAGLETSSETEQDARLRAVADGSFAPPWGTLKAEQMTGWFEDARTDLVRQWLAHPATMARIGFDGFANGGDGARKQGFDLLGAGEREAWEPAMEAAR
ncbi:alpha/beta hydrolase [Aureimonas sp. ME7]|uniref:alpha/beta hydrolase n=1 Tax=Aureimonas sp. ME7 TaxID=2744252 RepID=UPI0015F48B47|nr:alpha/beta hydrolase [Aureimonas sp. ME7]